MNLLNPFRSELGRIPYLNDLIDMLTAKINTIWRVQHKDDGTHTDVTCSTVTLGSDPADGSWTGNVSGSLVPMTSTADLGATITQGGNQVGDHPWRNLRLTGNISWTTYTSGGAVASGTPVLTRSGNNLSYAADGTYIFALTQGGNTHTLTIGKGTNGLTSSNPVSGSALVATNQLEANRLHITDGITAPAAVGGQAIIYVDTADGDLKVIFGDGTVKTIVVDT